MTLSVIHTAAYTVIKAYRPQKPQRFGRFSQQHEEPSGCEWRIQPPVAEYVYECIE
jgi:hypothetical protein